MKKVFGLFFIYFSLFLYVSCGNFLSNNDDFVKKLREETAYMNAPDVDTVVFVESASQGRLITNPDIKKKGYPFELSFFVEKDFPGKFDRWVVYEDYTYGKENKEINDASIILLEPVEDPTYEKVTVTVFDEKKKLTIVPHCIMNPSVQVQVEQKYQGQASVSGPSYVELGKPYDVTLKTTSVLGFSKWESYILKNNVKQPVSCYISENIELTDEEKESEIYDYVDLVLYDAKPLVTEEGTTISMKMILKNELESKLYIDGVLFSYPSLIVRKDKIAYTKLGKQDSKVQELSTLVDPYNLSGNLSLTNLSVIPTDGYDFVDSANPFIVKNLDEEEIIKVFYTDKVLSEVMDQKEFEEAAVVFTECFVDTNGEFSSKVLIKEADSYVLYADVYKIPKFSLTGNSEEIGFRSGSELSAKIGDSQVVYLDLKNGIQCKGFEVLNTAGGVVSDYRDLVSVVPNFESGYCKITVLSPEFDGYSINFITGERPYITKVTPESSEIAQAESIEISFSKTLDLKSKTEILKKIHVYIDSKEDSSARYFKKVLSSNILKLENVERLSEGNRITIKFDDGIASADGFVSRNIRNVSFKVNAVKDNIPPVVTDAVLYAHDLPNVNFGSKVIACNKVLPGSFDLEKLDTTDLYNRDQTHIKTVNLNKASYENCNEVEGVSIEGLKDNHFVLSFTVDDSSSGNSNIKSITLEERVVYLPENMVVPKRIVSGTGYDYERISGDGISLFDENGQFQASKYFTGNSESLKDYFTKKIEIPLTVTDSAVDVNYPFSTFLEIGGVHEYTVTVYDENCNIPSVQTFYVNFGPMLSFVSSSFDLTEVEDGFVFSHYDSGKIEEKTVKNLYLPKDSYKIRSSSLDSMIYYNGAITLYFSYNDLVNKINSGAQKTYLMVTESKTGDYSFIDENTVFDGTQLSNTLGMICKSDKNSLSTVYCYTNEIDARIPEDYCVFSNSIYYAYNRDDGFFGYKYKPYFIHMNGSFDFDFYDIDIYGTPYHLSTGYEVKDYYVSKYSIGDVVFWNKNSNSFFIKHFYELENLDTSGIPFAVIAYFDDNQIYGVPLNKPEAPADIRLNWALDSTKSSYYICTEGMKNGDSFNAKGIFNEIKDACTVNGIVDFSNLPLAEYVYEFGTSLGFDAKSANSKVKALATEWCIPTYMMMNSIREIIGTLDTTFSHFGKAFSALYETDYSPDYWVCNYGNRNDEWVKNEESLDSVHEKMPAYWFPWGDASLSKRTVLNKVIPVIELSEIIGN